MMRFVVSSSSYQTFQVEKCPKIPTKKYEKSGDFTNGNKDISTNT